MAPEAVPLSNATEDEEESDDEPVEEWARAAGLAQAEISRKPRKKRRALADDGSKIEVEHEALGRSAYVGMFPLIGFTVYCCLFRMTDWLHCPLASNDYLAQFGCLLGYIIYLVECFTSSKASMYLRNVCGEAAFREFVERLQESNPKIQFTIQNWHNETTSHTDAQGNRHSSTRRVNTHYAEMEYHIATHQDETLSPMQMLAMFHLMNGTGSIEDAEKGGINYVVKGTGEKVLIILCTFPLDYYPRSSQVEGHFNSAKETFYSSNIRDRNQDKKEQRTVDFHGYVEHMMVILSNSDCDSTSRPWWMWYWFYALCSVFLMTIPYRLCFFRSVAARNWNVTKHYSNSSLATDAEEPLYSLKKSKDPLLAKIVREGHTIRPKKEEHGDGGDADEFEDLRYHHQTSGTVEVDEQPPTYWKQQTLKQSFDTKESVHKMKQPMAELINKTFIDVATRDRQDPLPSKLDLVSVQRIEDSKMWIRYAQRRSKLVEDRGSFTPITDLKGSGQVKTMRSLGIAAKDMHEDMNEVYLFHGTSPAAAMSIGEDGFKVSMAGSNVGTMFGRGAYFAEASSKADEYAQTDDSGLYSGIYALLVCRVALGEIFRVTKSNIPAIEKSLASGEFDAVMGDREAAVGTYREFVVFDEAQIYPEYIILYRRVLHEDAGSSE